jgi:hypothetical protein
MRKGLHMVSLILVIVIVIVITAIVLSPLATAFLVALFATPLPAILTTLLTAAVAPDCVGHHV